ncbi:MAG: hypothetical protein ABFC75_02010 [Rectinema sp.]
MQDQERLKADIESTLEGAGLRLLEFSLSRPRGEVRVRAVVYSPKGTGTKECAKATRLMLPRLQILLGVQDADIEVSSPGIDRILKSEPEWYAFVGRALRVLMKDEEVWREGRLEAAAQGRGRLIQADGPFDFDIAAVMKARLDSTKEGE